MSFYAEMVAEAIKPSPGSRTARRNRLIKKALAERFGYKNVRVKGGRGTAYGWVEIEVKAKKPHSGECGWFCTVCSDEMERIKCDVWRILKETKLEDELYTYVDDMGYKRKECIVSVKLEET